MEEKKNGKREQKLCQMKGAQSIAFKEAPYILVSACVCGKKEGEGPLRDTFDYIEKDLFFGMDSWEEAESQLQKKTLEILFDKSGYKKSDIRYLFAGDLMGQLIATTFGIVDFEIPWFGLYGACSTMGEALSLGAMTVAGGYANNVISIASSHFASAEKTFRFPLEYSTQRPFSSTWTVTGCGAVVIGNAANISEKNMKIAKITGITTGKVVDYGCRDAQNMGACMAPAAADTIEQNLIDFGCEPGHYDKIITGDLGVVGQKILFDLLEKKGISIHEYHMDCGIEIFDGEKQDTHAGGSGCGCSATVLCGHILNQIKKGVWKRVLFVPTGALMSPISFNEGQNVPGIAQAVVIECPEELHA